MPDLDRYDKQFYEERLKNMTKDEMPAMFRQAEAKSYDEKMGQGIRLDFVREDVERTEELQELISKKKIRATKAQKRDLQIRDNRNRNLLLLNNEKTFGDSDKMKAVKDAIKSYEGMLREKIEGGTIQNAEEQAAWVLGQCNNVIKACEAYLSRRKSIFFWRWARRAEVENAKARFEEERKRLEELAGLKTDNGMMVDKDQKSAFEGVKDALKPGLTMLDLMNVEKLGKNHRIEKKRNEILEKKKKAKRAKEVKKITREETFMPTGKLHLEKVTEDEIKAIEKERVRENVDRTEYKKNPEKFAVKNPKTAIRFTLEDFSLEEEKFREVDKKRLEVTKEKRENEKAQNSEKSKEEVDKAHESYVKFTAQYDQDEKKASEKKYNDYIKKNVPVLKELLGKQKITASEKLQISKIRQDIVRMQDQMITDRSVYVRNATDMELKKKLGFGTFMDLSDLAELFETKEGFDALLKEYGTGSKSAALDTIAAELVKFEIKPDELFNESVLLEHMDRYIGLSKMVEAFNRLLGENPDYLKEKTDIKTKLDKLTAVSDYVRMKKQIVLSPMYLSQKEVNLSNYSNKRENFAYLHYRRLLMVDRMLGRNLKVSLGMKVEADPVLENKNGNVFAEADRQYALRLSKETKLQKQIDRKSGTYKWLSDHTAESIKKILKLKEIIGSDASETKKVNATYELQAEKLYLEELQRKIKNEESTDPEARKSEALMTLEEERLHVPFDFNMVDFDHIPDHRKGDIYDVCALSDSLKDETSEITPQNLISRKMGYEKFEAWIRIFKKDHLINTNQIGDMHFSGAKTMPEDIIFSDNFDRIVTHYKGSYHFHFTDAQMREQFSALAFSSSKEAQFYENDPEAMAYRESMFKYMILRQNSQMQGSLMRNMYGGVNKFMYMTSVDRRMILNPYQKMDIMSAIPYSNIDTEENSGKYLKFCQESNTEGRFMTMIPDHLCMGADLSWSVFNIHGCMGSIGLHDPQKLNDKMRKEYYSFGKKYTKEHPKAGAEEIGLNFMLSHPKLFSKDTFLQPIDDEEEEEFRKEELKDTLVIGVYGESIRKLLHNEYIEELTPGQLEKYRKRAKADGFQGYDRLIRVLNEAPVDSDAKKDLDDLYKPDFDEIFNKRHNIVTKKNNAKTVKKK